MLAVLLLFFAHAAQAPAPAPTSLLVRPLELAHPLPESRAVALIRVRVEDPVTKESSEELARRIVAQAPPEAFEQLATKYERQPTRDVRGLVGTYTRAMLDPAVAEAVFSSDPALHGPLAGADGGVYFAKSIPRDAGCRQVFVAGTDSAARQRAESILRELRAGADFAQVARERSDDRASALRGGQLAIYERGRRDALLRAAAFSAKVGEIVGPLETPLGFHVLQRVAPESIDARLRDDSWARVSSILVAFGGAAGADPALVREHEEAERIANDLARRIRDGEDMAKLAASFDDDRGGRARYGNLGWVRRGTSDIPQFFDRLFVEPPGTLIGPIASRSGFVLFRRENDGPRTVLVPTKNAFVAEFEWLRWSAEDPARSVEAPGFEAARAALVALQSDPQTAKFAEFSSMNLPFAVSAPGMLKSFRSFAEGNWLDKSWDKAEKQFDALSLALGQLEPWFLERVWPEQQRTIDAALAPLRERWLPLAPLAVDLLLDELGIDDPDILVEVPLVALWPSQSPSPDEVAASRDTLLHVSKDSDPDALLHATLHHLVHKLHHFILFPHKEEFLRPVSEGGKPVLDRIALHALFEAATESVTERVFQIELDGRARPCDVDGLTLEQRKAVRAIWEERVAGKIDVASASKRVAELLRSR
jgi:parvulin-like peptidyl-prolyl isomerase